MALLPVKIEVQLEGQVAAGTPVQAAYLDPVPP
jgi:hypothetical protein